MALPPRLWLPDGTHELPPPSLSHGPHGPAARPSPSSITPVQRIRRRALWRGEAGLPDKSVLVEWFPAAELDRERRAARRVHGLCHVHLLRLLDIGAADPRNAYAVCEAPDGVDLFTVLRAAPGELPAWWGASVAQAVTRALLAIERHQSRGPRRSCGFGHGRVNLATVFVGWDGSVRLLAFSPISSVGSRPEEAIAPELRLSDRLLTPAADVFAVGALLRDLLPASALRRPSLARLLRRCLHTQADQRITLSALDQALAEQLTELQAPLARASAGGEILGQSCPRATVDLLDADWGESTGDGFPALPPTLAPLSASTVALSPTWLRPTQPQQKKPAPPLFSLALPAALGLATVAALTLGIGGSASPRQLPPPASAAPLATPPQPSPTPTTLLPLQPSATALPLPALRLTLERLQTGPDRLTLRLRFTNAGTRPIDLDPAALRLLDAGEPELAPLGSLGPLQLGPGRVQRVQVDFPLPTGKTSDKVRFLSLREVAQMPK